METQREVFIFLSPEIQELLADNHVDLVDLLHHEGVNVRRGLGQDPTQIACSGYKEPATTIIASAAFVAALTPILTRVIEALSHKSVVVQEQVILPVEDSKGHPVQDVSGRPILQWVNRQRIIESEEKQVDAMTVAVKGPLGISISYQSAPAE
jgi:hypothetical protein